MLVGWLYCSRSNIAQDHMLYSYLSICYLMWTWFRLLNKYGHWENGFMMLEVVRCFLLWLLCQSMRCILSFFFLPLFSSSGTVSFIVSCCLLWLNLCIKLKYSTSKGKMWRIKYVSQPWYCHWRTLILTKLILIWKIGDIRRDLGSQKKWCEMPEKEERSFWKKLFDAQQFD